MREPEDRHTERGYLSVCPGLVCCCVLELSVSVFDLSVTGSHLCVAVCDLSVVVFALFYLSVRRKQQGMKSPIRSDLNGGLCVELHPTLCRNSTARENTGILIDKPAEQSAVRL